MTGDEGALVRKVRSEAMPLKPDELIRAVDGAYNALLDLEELSVEELDSTRLNYQELARRATWVKGCETPGRRRSGQARSRREGVGSGKAHGPRGQAQRRRANHPLACLRISIQ